MGEKTGDRRRQGFGRVSRRMLRRRRKRRQLIGLMTVVLVVLVWGAAYLALYRYVSKYPEKKICDNVYINVVNVSGMTREEAKRAMEEHFAEDEKQAVVLKTGEKETETTLKDLGFQYKKEDQAIEKAVSYGKKGALLSRYRKLRRLKKEKTKINMKLALDADKTEKVLKKQAVPLAPHATDAAIARVNGEFQITSEKKGKTIDIKETKKLLVQTLNRKWNHKKLEVTLPQKTEHPRIKAADLKNIKDCLGTFSTDAGGGERWKNLKNGAEKLNGTILMPGDVVSVHDITSPYDAEHGYALAGSYENGQVVDSYGGGICQVSTTLYNAVLYAELKVIKRFPHSMAVAYVDPSRDAAIAGDYKDFRFQNNYKDPIYIEGGIDGANQLTFSIYGKETRKESRKIQFESETTHTEEPGVRYQANADAAIGSIVAAGGEHTGRTARLWKIVIQDGKQVSRKIINNSTYNKSDQVISVGTKSSNAQASAIVRNAIGSQNRSKINAAISQAQALE